MRSLIRFISSAIAFVFFALLVLTTETAADELGFVSTVRALVRGGWRTVDSAGYVTVLFSAFWLSLGVAITLWIDYLARKVRRRVAGRSIVIFDLQSDPSRLLIDDVGVTDATIVQLADGSLIADLFFSDVKPFYIPSISCDAPFSWADVIRKPTYLRVQIWPDQNDEAITAVAVFARPHGGPRDAKLVIDAREKQVGYLEKRYSILRSKGEARSLQWR